MAKHGKSEKWKLRPPDDIWWIWHVHMLAPLYYDQDCKAIVGKGHNFLSFRVIKAKALKGIKNEGRASCESLGALAERSQRLSDGNKNGTNDKDLTNTKLSCMLLWSRGHKNLRFVLITPTFSINRHLGQEREEGLP